MPWLAAAPTVAPAPRTSCSCDSVTAAGTVPDSLPPSNTAHSPACSNNSTSTVVDGVLIPEGNPLSGNWSVNACPGLGRRGRLVRTPMVIYTYGSPLAVLAVYTPRR